MARGKNLKKKTSFKIEILTIHALAPVGHFFWRLEALRIGYVFRRHRIDTKNVLKQRDFAIGKCFCNPIRAGLMKRKTV